MKKIWLGCDQNGDRVELDLDEEKIHFILLVGQTGSGKSIFHYNLFRELSAKYSVDEIGFLLLDMTMSDFVGWKSEYLIRPVIHDVHQAIKALDEVSGLKTDKKIFIHIEECDMVNADRKGVEEALQKLKRLENVYVIYSTSRIDGKYLGEWMEKFVDLKVVFRSPSEDQSVLLLGDSSAYLFTKAGERILTFHERRIHCQPFFEEEAKKLSNFKL